jgi:hypothetical protein
MAQVKKSTCHQCSHTVHLVPVDGRLVAVDPEVIAVIPAGEHGGAISTGQLTNGRRVHAELCGTYVQQRSSEKLKREMRAFNRRGKRKEGGGL